VSELEAEKHRRLCKEQYKLTCDASALPPADRAFIERYGTWLHALVDGRAQPMTAAQTHFIAHHIGKVPASTDHERAWRRYHAQRAFECALEMDRDIGQSGYESTMRMFHAACEMGSERAAAWLVESELYVPKVKDAADLRGIQVRRSLSDYWMPDDSGHRVEPSLGQSVDDWDEGHWEHTLGP